EGPSGGRTKQASDEWVSRHLLEIDPTKLAPPTRDLVRISLAGAKTAGNGTSQLEVGVDSVLFIIELFVGVEETRDSLLPLDPLKHFLNYWMLTLECHENTLSHAWVTGRAVWLLLTSLKNR